MKNFNYRYGDIEVRRTAVNSSKYDYEVVKWSVNPLYGKADEYRVESKLGEMKYEKNGVTYSESCFKNPESCYVVTFVSWDSHEGWWDVNEVGTRPFDLDDHDYEDWCNVMKMIFDILPKPENNEEDY